MGFCHTSSLAVSKNREQSSEYSYLAHSLSTPLFSDFKHLMISLVVIVFRAGTVKNVYMYICSLPPFVIP